MLISQWADAHAYLPAEGNAEPGKYRCTRLPYQRAMLDDPLDGSISETVWMIASQLGKTLCMVLICEYFIDQQPTSILVVYPKIDDIKAWFKEKFTATVDVTPKMRGKIKDRRLRDSDNTILSKRFHGGNIGGAGANSPSTLRQRSKRIVIQDEIDAYEMNTEGDPCLQADKRAATFHNAVKLKASTPGKKLTSRIVPKFERSDKQYWFCPCPRCGHFQILSFWNVKWPEGRPECAVMVCEGCKAELSDAERIRMIENGQWRATGDDRSPIRGRHLSGIYRLLGKKSCHQSYLHEFAMEYLTAFVGPEANEATKEVFTNTFLCEGFEGEAEKSPPAESLFERCEEYPTDHLPAGVLILVAQLDVQSDRIYAEIDGWGLSEERWKLERRIFAGDAEQDYIWTQIDEFLNRRWKLADGQELQVCACFCDRRHKGKGVDAWAKRNHHKFFFSCQGGKSELLPVCGPPRKHGVTEAIIYTIGTYAAKASIYSRLNIVQPGPFYIHFPKAPDFDLEYFRSVVSEKLVTEFTRTGPRKVWKKVHQRNEGLDLMVYGLGAMVARRPNFDAIAKNLAKLAVKKAGVEAKGEAGIEPPQPKPEQKPQQPPAKPAKFPRGGGWMRRRY